MHIHVDNNSFIINTSTPPHQCDEGCIDVGEMVVESLSDCFRLPLYKLVNNVVTLIVDPMDYYVDSILWAKYIIKGRAEYLQGNTSTIPLNLLKQYKIEELALACQNSIYTGFTSSAHENTPEEYTFDALDQANLTGILSAISAQLSVTIEYKSKTDSGLVTYTAQEIKNLAEDAYNHVQTKRATYHTKKSSVLACTTVSEVLAITW